MQIKFYRNGASPQYTKSPKGLQVPLPGYTATSSWSGEKTFVEDADQVQRGRMITPPPAATMGLHQLTLEAFWID